MFRPRLWARCCALLSFLASLLFPAHAANSSGWNVEVTPYVWAFGVDGRVRPRAGLPTVAIDTPFGDLLEDVDFALFGAFQARRERLVLVADASWSNASRRGVVPPGLPAEAGLRQASLTLLGGWTLADEPGYRFAVLAGVRGWSIRTRAAVPPAGLGVRASVDFVDPLVAAQADWRLAERWSARVYADVGGFGAGSDSTWQVLAVANYRLRDRLYLSAGYRHLDVDYARSGTLADVGLSGPLLGATYSF